ncbi:hypothetical protein PCANC_08838 [Puccinia coronata f. sp. avenae]|uniref:Uncharacterized protein n=1 Tax=Puccinia coronata f. sp. avenae TaxID=200324 RepID=A0A2N5VIZ0_9BASI|nr:hypothetical protein PCANC_08838 [Puccinia coronata f. sp. avenae]PLW49952.1 hypothetical protein PCASD_01292 [Puccinia coronata f. sp. avenae]
MAHFVPIPLEYPPRPVAPPQLGAGAGATLADVALRADYFHKVSNSYQSTSTVPIPSNPLASATKEMVKACIHSIGQDDPVAAILAPQTRRLLEGVTSRIDGLQDQHLNHAANHSQRLIGVEQRLTGVEQRLTGVEQRLTGVEQRLTGVEQRLTGVETELAQIRESVQELRGQSNTMQQLLHQIVQQQNDSLPTIGTLVRENADLRNQLFGNNHR